MKDKMKSAGKICGTLVGLTSLLLGTSAMAQTDNNATPETVIVTGSRVISDVASSPTPVTIVSTEQLLATSPTTIQDGLDKLPIFQNSNSQNTISSGGVDNGGNVLNLRNFGAQRTLVLLDGHRVAPSNANGTVDTDVLPQMLIKRVDVVTGGASAVYGSDAVTGVVNFVLDTNFTGLKINANSGISTYGDGASYQAGVAGGMDIFGDRVHIEGSIRHFNQDAVPSVNRPEFRNDWILTGSGTAANPYANTEHAVITTETFGGLVTCACSANGETFDSNGVLSPFTKGTATGSPGTAVGGDGTTISQEDATTGLRTDESFGRFSYKVDNDTIVYAQFTADQSVNRNNYYPYKLFSGARQPNIFFSSDAFLSPAVQAQINSPTFTLTKNVNDLGRDGNEITLGGNTYIGGTVGADGVIGDNYTWDIYYNHSNSRQAVDNINNYNYQKMYAAEDAVLNSSGQVVCEVSLTSYASLYPGCVPMNPFGPTALTQSAVNYYSQDTWYHMTNVLDDVEANVSGDLLTLPAGPLKAALSAEYRTQSYAVVSDVQPTAVVDCTGLRLCQAGTPLVHGNTLANVNASDDVWEVAGEAEIPVIKDFPLIRSFNLNLAGRYTDYSISGPAETWKIGMDWIVNPDVRIRGTTSIDIRAPTLNDLYLPLSTAFMAYADLHTGVPSSVTYVTQGNPNLVPEVARTVTGGVVFTPSFIPNLTASVDVYHIDLKNAITSINGGNLQIATLCEASNGTSPYCSLYVRPLPFSNRTPANYPSEVLTLNLNAAYNAIGGEDLEVDYQFKLSDIIDSLPGDMNLRGLMNLQPVNETQNFASAATTWNPQPKGLFTGFATYTINEWSINLLDRWLSGFDKATAPNIVFMEPRTKATDYLDVEVDRRFEAGGVTMDGYLSIQNLFNTLPPIDPSNSTNPGFVSPAPSMYNVLGRYFTIGIRANI